MPEKIVVYAHPACGMLPPVLEALKQANADYEYVNIHEDTGARERVRAINHGYESVPTLVFPDGSTLTEPSAGALRRKLAAHGYRVPLLARLPGNAYLIGILIVAVLLVILRGLGVI
ncbi:MAG: hypothetical protein M5R40_02260 [Anaerolineae bacterium]|nr:hypothetical protein [Anaerolineae bacterium]